MRNFYFLFILFLLIASAGYAQQEAAMQWVFGDRIGLDFTVIPPVDRNINPFFSYEGCSSISDAQGNLLFYTDGENIYNSQNVILPNGNNLGGRNGATQSAILLRNSTTQNLLTLITNGGFNNASFSLIDTNLDGGNGDVLAEQKNIALNADYSGERLHAVIDGSGSGWIAVGEYEKIYTFQVTQGSIINTTPQLFNFPQYHSGDEPRGFYKFSPDGSKLAVSAVSNAQNTLFNVIIFDFDMNTGAVSNPVELSYPGQSNIGSAYGIEFSPNSQFLYVDVNNNSRGNVYTFNNSKRLLQFDTYGLAGWEASPRVLFEEIGTAGIRGSLQLAPNGTILYAMSGEQRLGAIIDPSEVNGPSFFDANNILITHSGMVFEGLPNFPSNYFVDSANQSLNNIIQGHINFDQASNGCASGSMPLENGIMDISANHQADFIATDSNGFYGIRLPQDQFTLTPEFANPSLWNVSPSNLVVDFTTQASPVTQDFCISPVGSQQDLEVIVNDMTQAQPGFDSEYQIILINKGNTTTDGNLSLVYEDSFMTMVSANPTVSSQNAGQLNWIFTNLAPFESRDFVLTMNLNTPTDPVNPLNSGDILSFTGSVIGTQNDISSGDNIMTLDQTVVNSFDPNDITCLEGEDIGLNEVGEFVHYQIRFENLGTAPARHVVIENQLDMAKFDLNSLKPLTGSHNFRTEVSPEGLAKFIFEDINLDFNDATNDGFILYKIKTVDTLIAGDTFSNQADIFFDFNPAITTNQYTTTVQTTASLTDIGQQQISVFPNPTRGPVYIETAGEVQTIELYNLAGKLMFRSVDGSKSIDLSEMELSANIYLLKVKTDQAEVTEKLILK